MNSFFRVIWFGIQGFRRNVWLSLVAVFTMTLMLISITIFALVNVAARQAYTDFNNNIDYIIFLKDDATAADVEALQLEIKGRSEVEQSTFFSKDAVRQNFDEIFSGEQSLQGVITADNNPLPQEIDVTFKDVNKIKDFNTYLTQSRFQPIIEKTSYVDNEKAVTNYLNFVKFIRYFGISLTVFLVLVAIVVVFNTIRLAIFSRREEIDIMRLVGATWQYIRGPFLVEGFLYGILGALLGSLAMYGLLYKLLALVSEDLNILNINSITVVAYLTKATLEDGAGFGTVFNEIIVLQVVLGVILGMMCSAFAVRRYLKD